MINPFKHSAKNVSDMFQAAASSDCAPGPAKVGAVLVTPIVVVCSFISAFMLDKKDE